MLEFATKIARLLMSRSHLLSQSTVRDQGLMGTLSVMLAAESRKPEALFPEFQDIVLFGSIAEGCEDPHDVDLMVFDQGFYSNVLSLKKGKYAQYGGLEGNLRSLLVDWFGFTDSDEEVMDTFACKVDLLVLPTDIFTVPQVFYRIAEQQSDPEFFQNAFLNMMRFNPATGDFEKIDLKYFEDKYKISLPHLRKSAFEPVS